MGKSLELRAISRARRRGEQVPGWLALEILLPSAERASVHSRGKPRGHVTHKTRPEGGSLPGVNPPSSPVLTLRQTASVDKTATFQSTCTRTSEDAPEASFRRFSHESSLALVPLPHTYKGRGGSREGGDADRSDTVLGVNGGDHAPQCSGPGDVCRLHLTAPTQEAQSAVLVLLES